MSLDRNFDVVKGTGRRIGISVGELRRMADAVERSSNIRMVSPNFLIRQSASGTEIIDNQRQVVWARITARSGAAYAWNTVTDNGAGTFADNAEGPSGTTALAQAYEVTGLTTVPTDGSAIVRMIQSDDYEHWVFAYSKGMISLLKSAVAVGTEPNLNLIPGADITLTTTDNAGANRLDLTIARLFDTVAVEYDAAVATVASDTSDHVLTFDTLTSGNTALTSPAIGGGATTALKAAIDGTYIVGGYLEWQSTGLSGGSQYRHSISSSNGIGFAEAIMGPITGTGNRLATSISGNFPLHVNDTVSMYGQQNSGGAITYAARFWLARIGPYA